LCGGINFTDLANLLPENIIEGRLEYTRQKTGTRINIQLSQPALSILLDYNKQLEQRGYLFPILDKHVHITAIQKQNRIHKYLIKTNKGLKRIAVIAEINVNLTTYVSRHSFATVLKNSAVGISLISEALGHSNIAITQIYLDAFDNSQIDKAMQNLL
jgi:integrase